jgi:hypothetical protein
MQPHQERVVVEKHELDGKRVKLEEFIDGSIFPTLPQEERDRLMEQAVIMESYSNVLGRRILAF